MLLSLTRNDGMCNKAWLIYYPDLTLTLETVGDHVGLVSRDC